MRTDPEGTAWETVGSLFNIKGGEFTKSHEGTAGVLLDSRLAPSPHGAREFFTVFGSPQTVTGQGNMIFTTLVIV